MYIAFLIGCNNRNQFLPEVALLWYRWTKRAKCRIQQNWLTLTAAAVKQWCKCWQPDYADRVTGGLWLSNSILIHLPGSCFPRSDWKPAEAAYGQINKWTLKPCTSLCSKHKHKSNAYQTSINQSIDVVTLNCLLLINSLKVKELGVF